MSINGDYNTIRVLFSMPVEKVNSILYTDPVARGAETLKEWIEQYPTARFTQVRENEVIITAQERNMDFIKEWLRNNTPISTMEDLS